MGFESLYKLSVIMQVVDSVSGPMQHIGQATQNSVSGIDKLSQSFSAMQKTGVVMTGAGLQLAEALAAPVTATFDTKRAISELSSLGVEQLGMMEQAATDFSSTWAGTNKADFITAAYDIKSGISSLTDEGVAKFTELSGITATATKSSIATMTSLFATGYGIYKDYYQDMSDMEFAEMFSSGISESVKQFKTNGNEMAAAIQTLGASATNAQVPLEEQLSILGMLQATMSGSEAGTKYNAFLRSAAKGGKALGLEFMDANNQLKSMPEILDLLHSKFGDTIDAAEKMQIQEAFGDSESVKLIDLMYNKTDALQGNIVSLYGTLGEGTEATKKMADAINGSDPAQFELIKQKAQNMAETIGNIVTPTVMSYATKVGNAIDRVSEWASSHEKAVTVIFTVIAALAAFLLVGGTTITTIGTIGSIIIKMIKVGMVAINFFGSFAETVRMGMTVVRAFGSTLLTTMRSAFISIVSAIQPVIASVWSFTAALLANPITWVVIGIVALIAAIVLLYNKCEWFRNLVNNLASVIVGVFGKALNVVKGVFTSIGNVIGNVMNAAKETVKEKLNNMKDAYTQHGGGIKGIAAAAVEGVKGYYTAGFTFLDKLTGGKLTEIKDKWSEKLEPVKEIAGTVMDAAKDTVTEKLNNMKNAYTQHGGGIKGIAAAAVEGVKGYYTAGFTFVDNLTGGKLTAIKTKFTDGINGIKQRITDSISWFRTSGSKIMDTFTSGIKEAVNKPVEAVKAGLQKIRNMLPFSDAKEGPLNQLTLSGTKVLTTLTTGIEKVENAPAEAVEKSFEKIDMTARPKEEPKPKTEADETESDVNHGQGSTTSKRRTIIEKLILNVDPKSIDELSKLLKLVDEIEDYVNSNNDDDGLEPA
nr:MAG TPA: tail tape measure [Caudoviricetes sp.]